MARKRHRKQWVMVGCRWDGWPIVFWDELLVSGTKIGEVEQQHLRNWIFCLKDIEIRDNQKEVDVDVTLGP